MLYDVVFCQARISFAAHVRKVASQSSSFIKTGLSALSRIFLVMYNEVTLVVVIEAVGLVAVLVL
jgi:hypothetical protein